MNLIMNSIIILIGIYSIFKILNSCCINIRTVISVIMILLFELYFIDNLLIHIYLKYKYMQLSNNTILNFAMHFSEVTITLDNVMVIFIVIITILNIRRHRIMKTRYKTKDRAM